MGKGTADKKYLTEFEKRIFSFCRTVVNLAISFLDEKSGKEFLEAWGKIKEDRWAGVGVEAKKLQRDNLHTRGQGAKNPLSNRNLRWTPLVIANTCPNWAKEVKDIYFDKRERLIIYKVELSNGLIKEVRPGKEVYNLPLNDKPFCVTREKLFEFWNKLGEDERREIKNFSEEDWTNNATIIPASEYTYWTYAVESFLICLLSVILAFYTDTISNTKIIELEKEIINNWKKFYKENKVMVPSLKGKEQVALINSFIEIQELQVCPLCRASLRDFPAALKKENRPENWSISSFPWKTSKKKEGEKESIQLLHIKPLIEAEIRHTPNNVRYGHRWCNVAMADASLEYTLQFFEAVLKNHGKC